MKPHFLTELALIQPEAKHWLSLVPKYIVAKELVFKDRDGSIYSVEVGFTTDLASTCRWAQYIFCSLLTIGIGYLTMSPWSILCFLPVLIFTRSGPWAKAAVLHDKFSDDEQFLRAMLVTNVFPLFAITMYLMVKSFKPIYRKIAKWLQS